MEVYDCSIGYVFFVTYIMKRIPAMSNPKASKKKRKNSTDSSPFKFP